MKLSHLGVDLAKNVFQLHGVDRHGKAVWRRRLRRHQWLDVLLATIDEDCVVGMEACSGAHHWAWQLQAIHRVRSTVMSQRRAKANQIRGLVAEYGLVAPLQIVNLRSAVPSWLEDAENGLTDCFRALLNELWIDLQQLDTRLKELDKQIEAIARSNPVTQRLQQLRGVGPLVATALVATVGDGSHFNKGRQMAAAIGLTPRQHSSGDKHRLLGISKRGDAYLRTLLIHGARAVVSQAKHRDDRLSRWVTDIAKRSHTNVAAVALANKTARIAWAMLREQSDYDPARAVA